MTILDVKAAIKLFSVFVIGLAGGFAFQSVSLGFLLLGTALLYVVVQSEKS